ncbi:leukemia inhibitory factor receptor-like [Aplochiton taeniatus]
MKQAHWHELLFLWNNQESISVIPEFIGQNHQWNWTSPMPLECASHSVRLRSTYKNLISQWSPLQTIPDPPADKDLTCETQDFESVECHWNAGRNTYLIRFTKYFLNKSCVQRMQLGVGERNWTLTVQNPLGTVELTDLADLSKRVHMLAPESVTATDIEPRNASLRLQWATEKYCTLPLVCQIQLNGNEYIDTESHGIFMYEVTWGKRAEDSMSVQPSEHSVALSLDRNVKHVVTVKARNSYGWSSPSIITIPMLFPAMNSTKIFSNDQGFDLSWSASTAASGCGYVVDWCPTFSEFTMDWIKVPAKETKARVQSNSFKDGVRYTLTVYHSCAQGVTETLDKREGYVKELEISHGTFQLESKQNNSDIQITWKPIAPENLSAFIYGYRMYYSDGLNVSTDDPNAKSLTATNLNFSSYTFTVKALTSVGESGDSSISVAMNSPM